MNAPATQGWYAALQRAKRAGKLTYQELCWLIQTRGSSQRADAPLEREQNEAARDG